MRREGVEHFLRAGTEPFGATEIVGPAFLCWEDDPRWRFVYAPMIDRGTVFDQGTGEIALVLARPSRYEEVMQLRALRNECREWMTFSRDEIGEGNQLIWWQSVSGDDDWRIWLVVDDPTRPAVGFLLLRRGVIHEGPLAHWYVTLGLTAAARGKGYGTLLYRAAVSMVDVPVYALILPSNTASIRAAARAGYTHGKWKGSMGGSRYEFVLMTGGGTRDDG